MNVVMKTKKEFFDEKAGRAMKVVVPYGARGQDLEPDGAKDAANARMMATA